SHAGTGAPVCTSPIGLASQLYHLSERVQFRGRPSFATCWRSTTLTVASCTGMSTSGGLADSSVNNSQSASWVADSPAFSVISIWKYWYSVEFSSSYSLRMKRWEKSSLRESISVQSSPSVEALMVQVWGSRPGKSLAETIAYSVMTAGSASW